MIMLAVIFAALVLVWAVALWLSLPLWVASVVTLLAGLCLLARWIYRRRRAAAASAEIEHSLAEQADDFAQRARPDQQAEIQAVREEFKAALSALKNSKLSRSRGGALYALPWYVIVGPSGTGKSTALRNCDLKFPYASQHGSVRGVGGTRNCDWWLTNEAVLLDTAGRYATHQEDRDEWLAFLDLLRHSRTKQPINGLILAVSVADLMTADEAKLQTLARQMRERMDQVIERLRIVVPVYVLLTKGDLIPGFVECFGDMSREQRGQIFGFTLAVRASDAAVSDEVFERHFTRLVQVVERYALARMPDERELGRRAAIYEFPQHLEALGPSVKRFLADVFAQNVYREMPMVRGVYLTSGTQQGEPIDCITRDVTDAFGLCPDTGRSARGGEGRSYFMRDLFSEVMFPDQDLAVTSGLEQRRRRGCQLATAATLATLAAVWMTGALRAHAHNQSLLHSTTDTFSRLTTANGTDPPSDGALRALDPLRERLLQLQTWRREGVPWSHGLGLYVGDPLLEPARSLYGSALRRALVKPVVEQLHAKLKERVRQHDTLGEAWTDTQQAAAFDQLRTYLLLTHPKSAPEPALGRALQRDLAGHLVAARAATSGAHTRSHAETYAQLLERDPTMGFERDGYLVRRVREVLRKTPAARRVLERLVREVNELGLDLDLTSMVGGAGLPLEAAGRVRGAYTRRAWEQHIREALSTLPEALVQDAWVLSAAPTDETKTARTQLCELRSRYFARYTDEWTRFLGSLRIREASDNARAVTDLQDLTRGSPPPLQRLTRVVAYNAKLATERVDEEKQEGDEEQTEKDNVLDRLRANLSEAKAVVERVFEPPCGGGDYLQSPDVDRALSGFYALGVPLQPADDSGAPAPPTAVEVYQEQLVFVRDALRAYMNDPTTADPLLARIQTARTRVRGLIDAQEVGWRPRFDALLWPPLNGASASSTSSLAREKGGQWCNSVARVFQRTLSERYPFTRAGHDVALSDLAAFYRPDSGIVWSFYESSLARDIVRTGDAFQVRRGSEVGAAYAPELLRFLERSLHLRDVLFPRGSEQPRVEFAVRVRPSPGIASVLFTVDGQKVDFHNGPEKWVPLSWPHDSGTPGASLRVRGASIDETLRQQGPWGLLRLLDKGTVSARQGERFFTVRWRLHTQNDVVIDVRPASADNPFVDHGRFLGAFRAPHVAVPRSITPSTPDCGGER